MRTAVVHHCNAEAIQATLEARDEGLIIPVLVGLPEKIQAAAEEAGLSIAVLQIDATEHSHAAAEDASQTERKSGKVCWCE